jgi:hypothetical protein
MDKRERFLGEKRVGILGGRSPGVVLGASGSADGGSAPKAKRPITPAMWKALAKKGLDVSKVVDVKTGQKHSPEIYAKRQAEIRAKYGVDLNGVKATETVKPVVKMDVPETGCAVEKPVVKLPEPLPALEESVVGDDDWALEPGRLDHLFPIFEPLNRLLDEEERLREQQEVGPPVPMEVVVEDGVEKTVVYPAVMGYGKDRDIAADDIFADLWYKPGEVVKSTGGLTGSSLFTMSTAETPPIPDVLILGINEDEAESADAVSPVSEMSMADFEEALAPDKSQSAEEVEAEMFGKEGGQCEVVLPEESIAPDIQTSDGRIVTTGGQCEVVLPEESIAPDIQTNDGRIVTTEIDIDPGDMAKVPGCCYLEGVGIEQRSDLMAKLSTYPTVRQLLEADVRGRVVGEGPIRHYVVHGGLPMENCPPDILVGDNDPVHWVLMNTSPIDNDKPVIGPYAVAGTKSCVSVVPDVSLWAWWRRYEPPDCGVISVAFVDGNLFVEYRVGPDKFTRFLACPDGLPVRCRVPLSAGDTTALGWMPAERVPPDISRWFALREVFDDDFSMATELVLRRDRPHKYNYAWAMNESNVCVFMTAAMTSQCAVLRVYSENRRVHIMVTNLCRVDVWVMPEINLDELKEPVKWVIGRKSVTGELVTRRFSF